MPSRHSLLADLEDKRRKHQEEGVEMLSWDLLPAQDASGYDPYDNPGAGKIKRSSPLPGKRRTSKP